MFSDNEHSDILNKILYFKNFYRGIRKIIFCHLNFNALI